MRGIKTCQPKPGTTKCLQESVNIQLTHLLPQMTADSHRADKTPNIAADSSSTTSPARLPTMMNGTSWLLVGVGCCWFGWFTLLLLLARKWSPWFVRDMGRASGRVAAVQNPIATAGPRLCDESREESHEDGTSPPDDPDG